MFYAMADEMQELSRGKNWTWCDIRPDMIVCYVFLIACKYGPMLMLFVKRSDICPDLIRTALPSPWATILLSMRICGLGMAFLFLGQTQPGMPNSVLLARAPLEASIDILLRKGISLMVKHSTSLIVL
jgi:hypothetical protein